MGQGKAAIVLQYAQHRIDRATAGPDLIAADAIDEVSYGPLVADQVVSLTIERTLNIRIRARQIFGNDGVFNVNRVTFL